MRIVLASERLVAECEKVERPMQALPFSACGDVVRCRLSLHRPGWDEIPCALFAYSG